MDSKDMFDNEEHQIKTDFFFVRTFAEFDELAH